MEISRRWASGDPSYHSENRCRDLRCGGQKIRRRLCVMVYLSTWTGVSISSFSSSSPRFWDRETRTKVTDTDAGEGFKHGRLWSWYEISNNQGKVDVYQLVDYKLGTILDSDLVQPKRISLLELRAETSLRKYSFAVFIRLQGMRSEPIRFN